VVWKPREADTVSVKGKGRWVAGAAGRPCGRCAVFDGAWLCEGAGPPGAATPRSPLSLRPAHSWRFRNALRGR
jgi:hypothetical protein